MPAKKTSGAIDVADIESKLPRTYFIMRGHITAAFGFTREETGVLIGQGVFAAKYPFGARTRARFLRSQVLEVAKTWSGGR